MIKDKRDFIRLLAKKVPAFGIFLGILSAFFMGLGLVLVKYVSYANPFLMLFVRGALHFSTFLSMIIYQREPFIPRVDWKTAILLVTSASFSALISIFSYLSYKFISVADSIAVMFTYPAMVIILSAIFFRDPCKLMHVGVVILSLAGTVLISKPSAVFGGEYSTTAASTDMVYGIVLALGSGFSFALYLLTLPKLLNVVSSSVLNLQAGACLVIFTIVAMTTIDNLRIPNCNIDGVIMVVSAIVYNIGLCLIVIACKVENPRNVSVSQTTEIVVVIVLQILILGEPPSWNLYVGTVLIIASVLLTWAMKFLENKKRPAISESSTLLQEMKTWYSG